MTPFGGGPYGVQTLKLRVDHLGQGTPSGVTPPLEGVQKGPISPPGGSQMTLYRGHMGSPEGPPPDHVEIETPFWTISRSAQNGNGPKQGVGQMAKGIPIRHQPLLGVTRFGVFWPFWHF